jgi:nucleoside-diphosphate-sugar epimerase
MILVTGSSGHLGANLVRRLLQRGEPIRVLLRTDHDTAALAGVTVERVYGDLRDLTAVRASVKGCNRVYHCAAKVSTAKGSEKEIYDCNVRGTRNVLRAALESEVIRVVVTGSLSAVGHDPLRPSNEEDAFYPFAKHTPYEISKAFMEQECWKAAAEGLNVVVAISCAIIGPFDFRPSALGQAFVDYANGKLFGYVPGGFEFVAVRDIVEGHLLCMEKGRSGEKYIFGSEYMTTDELVELWRQVTGRSRVPIRLNASLMAAFSHVNALAIRSFFPHRPERFTPGAIRLLRMHRRADISKAKSELGFQPTKISDAVHEAYDWYLEQRWIKNGRIKAFS